MLRDVVGTFLDTLTEREFDGPLLAVLGARGFTDIHFIHGAFEFGKDVLAKKTDPDTGETRQYVIQSKAGDIGQPEWRAVRPQLEECEYNTIGHPSFDPDLPRVAVLVTTGRLKGAAPADVTEYRKSVEARGLAELEIWERPDLIEWLCQDPVLGAAGGALHADLMGMLTSVRDGGVTDRRIETYTRRWLPTAGSAPRGASVEAAILVNALLRTKRLDLALCVALQLIRATEYDPAASDDAKSAAKRLALGLTLQICDQTEHLLKDPLDFVRSTVGQLALLTYPVISCRVAEALALGLALAREAGDAAAARFEVVLRAFAEQPGAARPVSDLFAPSVVAATVMLGTFNPSAAKAYLGRVARWMLDRYDEDLAGLGLASLAEDEEKTAERLLAGSLASTTMERRTSSYLATVVLDLSLHLGEKELYEAVRDNIVALRIVPQTTSADEDRARWARGGADVWPMPRIDFESWDVQNGKVAASAPVDPLLALVLAAACRSRHYPGSWCGVPST